MFGTHVHAGLRLDDDFIAFKYQRRTVKINTAAIILTGGLGSAFNEKSFSFSSIVCS